MSIISDSFGFFTGGAVSFDALTYQGTWNADTNTPTLSSGSGTQGHYYVVSVAGNTNLDGITDWKVNDWAVFNGTVWQKIDNTDLVSSVNGQTGTVLIDLNSVLTQGNQTNGVNIEISTGDVINFNGAASKITYTDDFSIGDAATFYSDNKFEIGSGASSFDADSVAIGLNAIVSGTRGVAVGRQATTVTYGIAIGYDATVTGTGNGIAIGRATDVLDGGVALGFSVNAGGSQAIGIGYDCTSTGTQSLAIGRLASATASFSTVVGWGASSNAIRTVAIGIGADALADSAIAIGDSSNASELNAIAIGDNSNASGTRAIAIGESADAPFSHCIALGNFTITTQQYDIAIGTSAQAVGGLSSQQSAIAIGSSSNAGARNAIAIGVGSSADGIQSIAIGQNANPQGTQDLCLGGSTDANGGGTGTAIAIGNGAQAMNSSVVSIGGQAGAGYTTFNANSVLIGYRANRNGVVGSGSICIGVSGTATHDGTIAIGLQSHATATSSVSLGRFCTSNADRSIMIGCGYASVTQMTNSTDESVAFGWSDAGDQTTIPQILFAKTTDSYMNIESGLVIGSDTLTTDAKFELVSSDSAFLIMRMTAAQASAITPANGMMLYVTDTNGTFTTAGFWKYEEGAWATF